jgi:hypothetical protein
MRWAQSVDKIYLDVKFSHRMDAAGCSAIEDVSVVFEDNIVHVKGKCNMSEMNFQVNTSLKLW